MAKRKTQALDPPSVTANASSAEKRRRTLAKRKEQESAELRQLEEETRGERHSKVQAMTDACWRGAAPRGSHKRPASTPKDLEATTARVRPTLSKIQQVSQEPPKKVHTRRPAVTIMSDDDDSILGGLEDSLTEISSKQAAAPSKARATKRPCAREEPDEDNDSHVYTENDESQDDEALEDSDGDLIRLNPKALRNTLISEQIQWDGPSQDRGKSLPPRELSPDDGSESGNTRSHKVAETREIMECLDEDSLDDLESEVGGSFKGHEKKASKRELARRAEVPTWSEHSAKVSQPSQKVIKGPAREKLTPSVETVVHDVNNGWPPQAHFVPPPPGARNIRIKAQPGPLQKVIRASIHKITGDALFVTAYPSVITISGYFRETLQQCSVNFNYCKLAQRFEQDDDFTEVIARLLSGRLSHVRSGAKKIASAKVEGFYGLLAGDGLKPRLKGILETTEYIYPKTNTGNLITTKPFHHPAIISALKDYYFTGARGSMAERYSHMFSSSMKEGAQKSELEVPAAMVCTIATSIHSALDDWSEGYHKKSDFNADLYEDVYKGHELFLSNIRKSNLAAYHRLMADFYKLVLSKHSRSASNIAQNAMALLDLTEMDT